MLPHEILKDDAQLQQQNAATVYHISTTDVSSSTIRPHSRHVTSFGPNAPRAGHHLPARPSASRSGGSGEQLVMAKRLPSSQQQQRQGSPGRGRAAGHAVINPSTILTSSVTSAIADHNSQIARMQSPTSPSRQRGGTPTKQQQDAGLDSNNDMSKLNAPPLAITNASAGAVDLRTPNSKAGGRSTIHHHLDHMGHTALVGLVGMDSLRSSYQTTQDDTLPPDAAFFNNGGSKVGELQTSTVISVDLKRLDLGVVVPINTLATLRPPICTLSPQYPKAQLHVDVTDIDVSGANNHPFRFDEFVQVVIGVDEIEMDRCLRYAVDVDVPAMFFEQPSVDAATGDLTFVVNPIATGRTNAKLALIDCASVNPETGECVSSAPLKFVIEVVRTKNILAASKQQQQSGHAQGSKIGAVPAFLSDVSLADSYNRPTSPSNAGQQSPARKTSFAFPTSCAHTLRREEIVRQHNEFMILGSPASSTMLRQRTPAFQSPLDLLELLRFSNSVAEKDRISGEAVEGDRQVFEQKLVERIKEEEREKGYMALDLCPLLLRLAQVCIAGGDNRRHGDAVEHLERICRIRLQHSGLSHSGGSAASSVSKPKPAEDVDGVAHEASSSKLEEFQIDLDGVSGDSASTATGDGKKLEALLQSYLVVATFLKEIGRYRESLEFAQQAARIAEAAFGDTSVQYLRTALLVSVLAHLLGEKLLAVKFLELSAGRAEVLLGKSGHATNVVLHLLGVVHMAEGDFSKALNLHDKALYQRQQVKDMDQIAVAESLALTAYARALCGINVGNKAKINTALENALTLVNSAHPSASSDMQKCAVLTLIARATALHGTSREYDSAIKLLQRAADVAARAKGFQSVECAVFTMELAAMQMAAGVASQATTSDLALAQNAFVTSLGPQHPYACRAAVLMAEHRMSQVPQVCKDQAVRALHYLRQQLSPSHRDLGTVADVAGKIFACLRDAKQQLQYTRYAYDIAVQHFTPTPMMRALETRLVGAYSAARVAPPQSFFITLENRTVNVREDVGESSVENIEPLQNLGEAMLLNGDYERAHHVFTRALKIADSVNFIFLLGHLFKPAAQLSINDLQERNRIAGDRINTALAFSFATILYQIAVVFESQGQSDDAQSTFLQALAALEISGLTVGDSIAEVIFSLAKLLYCDGHYGDSLAYAEKGYNLILDHASLRTVVNVSEASALMHVILQQLNDSGYVLVRHHDSRHRFTSYV